MEVGSWGHVSVRPDVCVKHRRGRGGGASGIEGREERKWDRGQRGAQCVIEGRGGGRGGGILCGRRLTCSLLPNVEVVRCASDLYLPVIMKAMYSLQQWTRL